MNFAGWHFFNSNCPVIKTVCRYTVLMGVILISLGINQKVYAQDLRDLLKTADEYYEKEQFHSAAQYYQVAVGIQDNDPETLYRLAQSYRAIFDYSLAATYYRNVIELDKTNYPLATFHLAQMQKSLGNFKDAREGFEAFVDYIDKATSIPKSERKNYQKQAELEIEGCLWAIEQLGKSWTEMGFAPMPEPVNSNHNDYAVSTRGEGEVITLTSGKKGAKGGLLDNRFGEYFTDNFRYRNKNNQWVEEQVSDHFDRTNTKFSDGAGTYDSKGERYYFTSCYEGNAYCKLYVTRYENGTWKNPELLNENINAKGFDSKHPTLSASGDTLIFVTNRPGGAGGNDLWYSVSTGEDSWGEAKPLPGKVNTPFNEASPYSQNNLLFFSSDGHSGMGGMDIFMASDYMSTKSSIQNLGTPFNSGYDDSFFSLTKGKGYLSSNRPNGPGGFDIYHFNVPIQNTQLEEYLTESADGTHLRSRIRNSDGSNLYAARDEDQFYYDNLSNEEKARLERILNLKNQSQGDFDPSELSKEDFKYYKKMDIETKALVERLAQKRLEELTGQTTPQLMTVQEKLDWEYYKNISDEERMIVDRIIDIKVEARRRALNNFSPEEQRYLVNSTHREQIESRLQLKQLSSLENRLVNQQKEGVDRLNKNLADNKLNTQITPTVDQLEYAQARAQDYQQLVAEMESPLLLHYQQLSPAARNILHQSAIRQYIITHPTLSSKEKKWLTSELGLHSDLLQMDTGDSEEQALSVQIRKMFTENLESTSKQLNLPPEEIIAGELISQQLILETQLAQIETEKEYTRDLQDQLKAYTSQQQTADAQLETQIADAFYTQEQLLLPLLSSKESYYFNTLNPGQQLRIDRLATLVQTQTRTYQVPEQGKPPYISQQYATDQWFYQELSPEEQRVVDELVAQGWQPNQSYSPEQVQFMAGLSETDKDRIERMSGGRAKINFEIPEQGRLAISGSPADNQAPTSNDLVSMVELPQTMDEDEPVTAGSEEPKVTSSSRSHGFISNENTKQLSIDNQPGYVGAKIYFDFNQHSLRAEAKTALKELINFLQSQQKPVRVVIEGHTDNIGTPAHNYQLSKDRSLNTAAFFERSADQIEVTTESFGEQRPVSSNRTALGRQLNRRVELRIQGVEFHSTLQTFIVRPGVSLYMITEATGLLEQDILRWNGLKDKTLQDYQPLRLPVDIDYNSVRKLLYSPEANVPFTNMINYHTVKNGENLFRLAMRYQTTVEALETLNNISGSELLAGQQIRVK